MNLLRTIQNYLPYDENEEANKKSFLCFLNSFGEKDWAIRENWVGHLTSSAWVVNKNRTKVLFAYHNMYNSRAWLGGHADGDLDLKYVAEKEAKEESGLKNITLLQDSLIDLNIQSVLAHKKRGIMTPTHLHFNAVYVFEADENDEISHAEGENSAVEWIAVDSLLDKVLEEHIKPIYKRIMEKVKKL